MNALQGGVKPPQSKALARGGLVDGRREGERQPRFSAPWGSVPLRPGEAVPSPNDPPASHKPRQTAHSPCSNSSRRGIESEAPARMTLNAAASQAVCKAAFVSVPAANSARK